MNLKNANIPQADPFSQGGRPQPLPELISLRDHPGDLTLLASQYISKFPPESIKELAIQLYLHSLASDPRIQGADHAMMVAQQHIQEADLSKKGPKAPGPQAQAGPAAAPQDAQPIASMGPGGAEPKMAAGGLDPSKALNSMWTPVGHTNAMLQSAMPPGLGSAALKVLPGAGVDVVSGALDKIDSKAPKNPAIQPAAVSATNPGQKKTSTAISSFSYEKFSSAQAPFAYDSGKELARIFRKAKV